MNSLMDPARGVRGTPKLLVSAVLFAVVFLLSGTVGASAETVFGWRILITACCYALVLVKPTPRAWLREYWCTLTAATWKKVMLPPLCAILGLQLWLFSWAPQHGHALDASLGFLILPLTLVLGGRLILNDQLTSGQWVAVGIAAIAVVVELVVNPQVSWVTFVICIGYPVYFVIRRRAGLDNPMAFGVEVVVMTPVAVFVISVGPGQQDAMLGLLPLLGIGLAGAGAMALYLAAARVLPIPLFGLLGYVELVLLVVVSLLLGEQLTASDFITYGLLASALLVLAIDSHRTARGCDAHRLHRA